MNELKIARANIANTAHQLQKQAAQCNAVAALLGTLTDGAGDAMPVEELAKALLPLDLCIVHRNVVSNALHLVKTTDDIDSLSREELAVTERRLAAALKGHA